MTTIEKIKELLADQLGIAVEDIGDDADLVEDLKADSLDMVQMLVMLEREFGITFDFNEVKSIKTVRDVATFADDRKKQ